MFLSECTCRLAASPCPGIAWISPKASPGGLLCKREDAKAGTCWDAFGAEHGTTNGCTTSDALVWYCRSQTCRWGLTPRSTVSGADWTCLSQNKHTSHIHPQAKMDYSTISDLSASASPRQCLFSQVSRHGRTLRRCDDKTRTTGP